MSEHKKTITALSWCPHNPDLFASGSTDNLVIIWNVAEQKIIAKLDNTKGIFITGMCFLKKKVLISVSADHILSSGFK